MPLTLRVHSDQRKELGDEQTLDVGPQGATIGRSLDNDWVLPDTNRYVSSRHATVDFQAGAYYLIDTSTNGVYVNSSDTPVGAGKPQRLFNGDRIMVGDYEIFAEISEDSGNELDEYVDSVILDRVCEEEPDIEEPMLLEENEITGAQSLNARLLDDSAAQVEEIHVTTTASDAIPVVNEYIKLEATGTAASVGSLPGRHGAVSSAAASSIHAKGLRSGVYRTKEAEGANDNNSLSFNDSQSGSASAIRDPGALLAFLRGLEITSAELGNPNSEELMLNAGKALREFITGMMDILQTRASLKNTFRLEQTTIQPGTNNPLKFSANVDDAIRNLLIGQKRQFVPTVETIRQACSDVKLHEEALSAAMKSAVNEFADRLEPEELQSKFDASMKRGSMFGGNKKSRYWDLYAELYGVMTQRGNDQFPHIIGEEFTKAYEDYRNAAARRRSKDNRR